MLTASKFVLGETRAKFAVTRVTAWFREQRSNFTLTTQKKFREKNRRGSPGALPARRLRITQTLVFASRLAGGNGVGGMRLGGEVASSSLPEKKSQEKTDQGVYVLYP